MRVQSLGLLDCLAWCQHSVKSRQQGVRRVESTVLGAKKVLTEPNQLFGLCCHQTRQHKGNAGMANRRRLLVAGRDSQKFLPLKGSGGKRGHRP